MMKRGWMAVLVVAVLVLVLPPPAHALNTADALALVAMPLVVADVANMNNVPLPRLMDVVSMLNAAAVPPPQFVEVVRYVPVALVSDIQQPNTNFVQYVQTQYDTGLRGPAFGTVVVRQLQSVYDLPVPTVVDLSAPQILEIVDTPVPPIVWTRVAQFQPAYVPPGNQYLAPQTRYIPPPAPQYVPAPVQRTYAQPAYGRENGNEMENQRDWSNHPHGGPPGQLKKMYGYQTGAEVVHGYKPGPAQHPGRGMEQRQVIAQRPVIAQPHGHGRGHVRQQSNFVAPAPRVAPVTRVAPPRRVVRSARRTVAPARFVAPRRVVAVRPVVARPAAARAVGSVPPRAMVAPGNGGRGKH